MADTLLNVKDLKIDYKTDLEVVHAVNGVSFTVDRGETLGIVGETGAGKTTTALSLLRLLPSNIGRVLDGSIEFDGKDILKVSEKEMRSIRGARISMIFQDPMTSLDPLETVGEQIERAILLHAAPGATVSAEEKRHARFMRSPEAKAAAQKRVDEVLTLVGIPPARKKEYPHQFSGGMKQRVVIAMALACEPELLIADEPTTALDVTIQAQVLAMINELREKLNTSMIMITHDLGIVAQVCDKVAVMYAGEVIEYGTVEDIFLGDVHHPYTVGLMGSIPNLDEETDRLSPIDGLMPDPTNLPKGCSFSLRCPHCKDICKELNPDNYVDGTHSVKCFLYNGGAGTKKEVAGNE
ncbi:MAG: ABC transporter ATP-binding protein [Ruminococcaceae bacterium]|nr:ABC transporter ATP-binding protein [Oscillospiraceae bacterium]